MEFATIIGLFLGWGALITAHMMEGGSIASLLNVSAAVIVFGGTLGTAFICFPMQDVLNLPKMMGQAFSRNNISPEAIVPRLVGYAEKARREGLLALEAEVADANDTFLQKGMQLVADGIDLNTVKDMLETELSFIAARHASAYGILEAMGGFAPTMGIIGTVMGLISVLGNLSDPSKLGPSIAVAFIATLYGVSSANLLWLPLGVKLKRKSEEEILVREMMLAGILSIQSGDNPQIVEEKLKSYLSPSQRLAMAPAEEAA